MLSHHIMKEWRRCEGKFHVFLSLSVAGGVYGSFTFLSYYPNCLHTNLLIFSSQADFKTVAQLVSLLYNPFAQTK
jgi:hypothetical protein